MNVVVGIVGALVAGFVIVPMFGTGTIHTSDFFGELSSPDTEGFSSFHTILHTMSPLIPRR